MKKSILFIAIAIIAGSILQSCKLVDPKEVGFKISKSGDYRGIDTLPSVTGYVGYVPFLTTMVTIPTTIQHIVWAEAKSDESGGNQEISISCQGGSGFKVDVGINFRANPVKASRIYLKYKTDDLLTIAGTFLRNNVRGSMQDVSGYMSVDSLLNNLPGFEAAARHKIDSIFSREGFILDNFNVLNRPRPIDPKLEEAINAKIQAKQNAERTKMEEQSSIAQANKDIAKARGDSASAVITASGEARAIQLKQAALSSSPQYVEMIKAQRWDGKTPTTVLGGGTGTFINLNGKN